MAERDIAVLDQDLDDGEGTVRVRVGKTVRYLIFAQGVFSDNVLSNPNALVAALKREPECIPDGDWTDVEISRDDGAICTETSTYDDDDDDDDDDKPKLRLISNWVAVDVLSLQQTDAIRSGVSVVQWDSPGGCAIAKIACFHDELRRIKAETWAYAKLKAARGQGPVLAPRMLAQITENGRPIGVLLERLAGSHAGTADLTACEAAVRQLHRIGIVHGDLNRYNFIVDRRNGGKTVRLIDFEKATPYDEAKAAAELASLPAQLADESGVGGSFTAIE